MGRLAVLALLMLCLVGCSDTAETPEDRVRGVIGAMESAAEAGSPDRIAEYLDQDYSDPWHTNRRAATRSLSAYLRRHRNVHLFTLVKSVVVAPDRRAADAVVYVAMSGVPVESMETLLAVEADLYRFDIRLTETDDGWRVRESRWQRTGPAALR